MHTVLAGEHRHTIPEVRTCAARKVDSQLSSIVSVDIINDKHSLGLVLTPGYHDYHCDKGYPGGIRYCLVRLVHGSIDDREIADRDPSNGTAFQAKQACLTLRVSSLNISGRLS